MKHVASYIIYHKESIPLTFGIIGSGKSDFRQNIHLAYLPSSSLCGTAASRSSALGLLNCISEIKIKAL